MPRFTQADLDAIRASVSLRDLVGRHVKLERAGRLMRGCCPIHLERRPSFYLYPDHYHCFACGAHGDVFSYVMATERCSFVEAVERLGGSGINATSPAAPNPAPDPRAREDEAEYRERRRRYAAAIWLEAKPLPGTPAEDYLAGRGIDFAVLGHHPGALRFHPGLKHFPSGRILPALLGAIHGDTGSQLATHRTWLERGPRGWVKARVEDPKLTAGPYPGGSIRLWRGASGKPLRDALPDETVVIGEGIETCLSVAMGCPELRILAAVSQGNMAAIWLPPQITRVILLLDNDRKPRAIERAQAVVERHLALGRDVRIARAAVGKDFNDTLTAWGRAA